MTTFEVPPTDDLYDAAEGDHNMFESGIVALSSPFALTHIASAGEPAPVPSSTMTSPFLDGFVADASDVTEMMVGELLLAELEDDDFADTLQALANEAANRSLRSPVIWHEDGGPPRINPAEAEQWLEAVEARVDRMLAELEDRFADRSVESVSDEELELVIDSVIPPSGAAESAMDAQELLFGGLAKKFKKAVRGAKKLVKKGIRLASKFLPLGIIFRRLRPIIKPLLRRVLSKAIGKLPQSLQGPARRLAARYGLREADHESEYGYLAAEFDAEIVEAVTASDQEFAVLHSELLAEVEAAGAEPSMAEQLDLARYRLGRALEEAEPGEPPLQALEQFIPVALLPIAKMGIKVAGRRRVVTFLAGLLARLIAPIVGRRLAQPLSIQIADKGLRLLKLEAEEGDGRGLGTEALVAATEETLHEIFELPEQWLENEMLLELAVQEAFHKAAVRHFPGDVLRADAIGPQHDDERGVWMMMPRLPGKVYRYKQYSRVVPLHITPRMARSVLFSSGETLEDRLFDEGIDNFPVSGEMELYELLPGAEEGHIGEDDENAAASGEAMLFDELEEVGELPIPDEEWESQGRRRRRRRRKVRISAGGRVLRRRSPVALRLDMAGSRPVLHIHLTVSERRALAIAEKLGKHQQRDVVGIFRKLTGRPMRQVVARRLRNMLRRRKLSLGNDEPQALADRLFDAMVSALGSQIQTLGPAMVAVAKDPAPGFTLTAVYTFPSKSALSSGPTDPPKLALRPGRYRG